MTGQLIPHANIENRNDPQVVYVLGPHALCNVKNEDLSYC